MRDFIKTFIGLLLIVVIIYAVFYILNIDTLREKETTQEEIIVEKESPYVNKTVVEEPKNEVTNKAEEKSDLDKLQSIINSKKSAIESTPKPENKVENKVENKPASNNTTNTQSKKMIPGSSIITPDIKTMDIKK